MRYPRTFIFFELLWRARNGFDEESLKQRWQDWINSLPIEEASIILNAESHEDPIAKEIIERHRE